jgi:hypothetical protein
MYKSTLNAAAIAYAKEQLGESDEVVKHTVAQVQKFLENNPNINARTDQRTVLHFLRSCKFNLEQVEKKIKK